MASDRFTSKGQAWFCTTGLPSDIVIEVEDMAFHLHKFPLMSRSGKLHRMITEQEILSHGQATNEDEDDEVEESCVLALPDFPGGSETFEIAAKFCYGVKIELTPSNVAPLRCAGEYLEMTEEQGDNNLISKTETFLSSVVLRNLKAAVKTLGSCETLLPEVEELGIIERCIDSIASNAASEHSTFGFMDPAGELMIPQSSSLWNGIDAEIRQRERSEWWHEEVTILGLPLYKRLISAMESRNLRPESIEGSLICYAKKFIPGLSRRNRVTPPTGKKSASVSEDEQRELLETVVSYLPAKKKGSSATTTRVLFGLLRTSNILNASESCRATLERKIASQLNQATLDDLLLPSYSYLIETLYDIDCVQRILGWFLEGQLGTEEGEGGGEEEEEEEVGDATPSGMSPLMLVGKLMDGYLAEISSDGNLVPEKFYELATALPEHSRIYDDGLYRAIDVYLKAHPWISEDEREKICGTMDCQKLTLEACTHAAQNERLPLRVVVQVLFFEQLQLRHAIAGSFVASDPILPDSARPSQLLLEQFVGQTPTREPWQTTFRGNRVMQLDMDGMRARVHELERECSMMRKAIKSFDKSKNGGIRGGSSARDNGHDTEDGNVGGWSSFTRKFGCKFKTQVCDSQGRSLVDSRRATHMHPNSKLD